MGHSIDIASRHKRLKRFFAREGMDWEIETLFQALKERGFDRESTRLKDRDRRGTHLGLLLSV